MYGNFNLATVAIPGYHLSDPYELCGCAQKYQNENHCPCMLPYLIGFVGYTQGWEGKGRVWRLTSST